MAGLRAADHLRRRGCSAETAVADLVVEERSRNLGAGLAGDRAAEQIWTAAEETIAATAEGGGGD
jgi:hypothetical protein